MSRRATSAAAHYDRAGRERAMLRWFPAGPFSSREQRLRVEDAALDAFVREAVMTHDEHDESNPVKPIPMDELPYMAVLLRLLLRERMVIVPKSRQLMVTWILLVYVLWKLLRLNRQRWAWVAQKKEDAYDHVEDRMKLTIWDHLPAWLIDQYTVAQNSGNFIITHHKGLPWNSALTTYPRGINQLRGKTHSGIVLDEAAHIPQLKQAWKGFAPTTQGRRGLCGQIIAASSAEENSYFEDLAGAPLGYAVMVARGLAPPSSGKAA